MNQFKLRLVTSLLMFGLIVLPRIAISQVLFYNNGADITINQGATVIVKTASLENAIGNLSNAGSLIIEEDLINHDFISGGGQDGYFRVYGDWINNDVFQADISEVELSGANQLITGSSITSFYNLTLTGSDVKTMTIDAFVTNHLELNDYELATDTNLLSVTNPDPGAITFTNGFVSSESDGRLLRVMDVADDYIFPVGSSVGVNRYRPVVLNTNSTDYHEFAVRLANVDPNTSGYDRAQLDTTICRVNPEFYHYIERRDGTQPTDFSIHFVAAADGNWNANANWNSTLWTKADPSQLFPGTPLDFVTTTGWDDFSSPVFALAHPGIGVDLDSLLVESVTCYEGNDGSISVDVSGGSAPFDYEWSNNETGSFIDNLTAGTYTVTITDVNDCSHEETFAVAQPPRLIIAESVSPVSCPGGEDGIIALNISGGTPSYDVQWPTADTGLVATDLTEGTYNITVIDGNGCITELEVEIDELPELIAEISTQGISCFGFDDAVLTASVEGGTPGYTYNWVETGDNTSTISDIPPGTYTLLVEDNNSCETEVSVEVSEPQQITGTTSEDKVIALGQIAELFAEGSGGVLPYQYTWIPSESLNVDDASEVNASPEQTTTYTVTITDENGCNFTDSILVIVDQILYDFPNAFVPGGYNNEFFVLTSQTVEVRSFQVFNRWGQLLHDDATSGWNGEYDGELQPMDTYVYQAKLLLPDGSEVSERGHFILIW